MRTSTTLSLSLMLTLLTLDASSPLQAARPLVNEENDLSEIDQLARTYLNIQADALRQQLGLDSSQNPFQADWVRNRPTISLDKLPLELMPNTFPVEILRKHHGLSSANLRSVPSEELSKLRATIEPTLPSVTKDFTDEHELPSFLLCDLLNQLELRSPNQEYLGSIECYDRLPKLYLNSEYLSVAYYNKGIAQVRIDALNLALTSLNRAREGATDKRLLENIDFVRGEILYLQKGFSKAKAQFGETFEKTTVEGLKVLVMIRLGDIAFHLERYAECIGILEGIRTSYPTYFAGRPLSLYYLAESHYQRRTYENSLALYEKVLQVWRTTQPEHYPFALMRKADILTNLKRYREAKNLYFHVFRTYPGTYGSNVSAIKIADLKQKLDLSISPQEYTVLRAMINEVSRQSLPTYLRHEVLYRQGMLYIRTGNIDEGIIILKAFCKKFANSYRYGPAMYLIETTLKQKLERLYNAGEYHKLLASFALDTAFIPVRSFNEPFLVFLCKAFDNFQLYRQIVALYEQIPPAIKRKESGNGIFHLWVAQAYTHLQRNEDALVILENIPYKTSDRTILRQVYLYQAEILRRLKRYQDALVSLDRLAEYADNQIPASQLHFWRAELNDLLDREQRALQEYKLVLSTYEASKQPAKADPDYVRTTRFVIADLQYQFDRCPEALSGYADFLRRYPEDYRRKLALFRTSLCRGRQQQLGKAKELLALLPKGEEGNLAKALDTLAAEGTRHYEWLEANKRNLNNVNFNY